VSITVSATSGRFLWATGPTATGGDAVPLVRIAVVATDTAAIPVRLAGTDIAGMAATPPAPASLPVAAFAGPEAPVLDSALFCTVELSSLTLRYSR
jgi:hypothetical protein